MDDRHNHTEPLLQGPQHPWLLGGAPRASSANLRQGIAISLRPRSRRCEQTSSNLKYFARAKHSFNRQANLFTWQNGCRRKSTLNSMQLSEHHGFQLSCNEGSISKLNTRRSADRGRRAQSAQNCQLRTLLAKGWAKLRPNYVFKNSMRQRPTCNSQSSC